LGATLGFGALILIGFVLSQTLVYVAYAMVRGLELRGGFPAALESDGLALSLATCLDTPLTIGLCLFFAWLKRGIPLRDYFAVRGVSVKALVLSVVSLLLVSFAMDQVMQMLGRPVVPQFMVDVYRNAGSHTLLWIALLVGAPLTEEIFFRGFLFEGLRQSRLGGIGAVLLTSVVWAAIHLQYDAYGIAAIFLLGLLFGYARLRTQSILPPMLMHVVCNLVATLQVALLDSTL
jgi:uncharacterized protein